MYVTQHVNMFVYCISVCVTYQGIKRMSMYILGRITNRTTWSK